MLLCELRNRVELNSVEPPWPFEGNRIQPELCSHVLAPYVNVWRFTAVKRNKEGLAA